MEFERQLLEQREEFEKAREHEKAAALESVQLKSSVAAKLSKLSITKFNGKVEDWLPFWGKFKSEIDSSHLAKLTKFGYLKELLEKHVRNDIEDCLSQMTDTKMQKQFWKQNMASLQTSLMAYVKNIMELPVNHWSKSELSERILQATPLQRAKLGTRLSGSGRLKEMCVLLWTN